MNEETNSDLQGVAVRILEEAAFFFSDPIQDPSERPDSDWPAVGVQIRWGGDIAKGTIRAWSDPEILPVLAANMLGTDESDPEAASQGRDALGEVLNMVLGNFLTETWGPAPVFNLGTPTAAVRQNLETDRDVGVWLFTEGHPILFRIEIDP